jgi:hypothetical protein
MLRRKKIAFQETHLWENAGMFIFAMAALAALWFLMTTVINW